MAKNLVLWALLAVLGVLGMGCTSNISDAQTCTAIGPVKDSRKDATPVIFECLRNLREDGSLKLLPGRYQLLTPLAINRSVTIETAPLPTGRICTNDTGAYCAVLVIGQMPPQSSMGIMPIEVTAKNVRFRSIVIIGAGHQDVEWQRRTCLNQNTRPLGGGVRVKADGFEMTNVVLKDFSCYAAMEVVSGVRNVKLSTNVVGPNGNHKDEQMWSDGITIHDGINIFIGNNIFRDNTDVQLVFGGCQICQIKNNRFSHSYDFNHASFAELMLHAWPTTSGNFTRTTTSGNMIDCGPYRRCGYGMMIGGEPWYPSKAFGGTVTRNRVRNALLGLNVDKLTGSMDVRDNIVSNSGGLANSDCGERSWPAVNISPASKKFLVSTVYGSSSLNTEKCLLNRN